MNFDKDRNFEENIYIYLSEPHGFACVHFAPFGCSVILIPTDFLGK